MRLDHDIDMTRYVWNIYIYTYENAVIRGLEVVVVSWFSKGLDFWPLKMAGPLALEVESSDSSTQLHVCGPAMSTSKIYFPLRTFFRSNFKSKYFYFLSFSFRRGKNRRRRKVSRLVTKSYDSLLGDDVYNLSLFLLKWFWYNFNHYICGIILFFFLI